MEFVLYLKEQMRCKIYVGRFYTLKMQIKNKSAYGFCIDVECRVTRKQLYSTALTVTYSLEYVIELFLFEGAHKSMAGSIQNFLNSVTIIHYLL